MGAAGNSNWDSNGGSRWDMHPWHVLLLLVLLE
jgi:hypothetical protein